MPKPKLFVGSSQKNLRTAHVLAECLEACAEVTVWDEGVFDLNKGFLETLEDKPEEYDFAVFVLASDDVTTSKDETKLAPRDNVLFEGGLFMGVLGRERVFFVYDQAADLKIPSDFAGVTLAPYDGSRMEDTDAPAGVRKASRLICDRIKVTPFPYLIGKWKSRYPMTWRKNNEPCEEEVEISARGVAVCIETAFSAKKDYYTASGQVSQGSQIVGEWKSREADTNTRGVFVLNVSPDSTYMYGYFTSPGARREATFGGWVLAKMTDANEAEISERLKSAECELTGTTICFPPPASSP